MRVGFDSGRCVRIKTTAGDFSAPGILDGYEGEGFYRVRHLDGGLLLIVHEDDLRLAPSVGLTAHEDPTP